MTDETLFENLCRAFGPSSDEGEVREIIIKAISPFATSYKTDKVGNVVAFKKGKKRRARKLLFSAHMDEVGLMVRHIDEDGYIYFGAIGGIDKRVMPGKRIVIGENRLDAVISAKPIHLQKPEERGVADPIQKLYADIGCQSREDTQKYVRNGDTAVFAPNYERFGDRKIKSKAIDDRFGCYMLCLLLREEAEYDTYFAFTVAEEEGCRGAAGVAFSEKPEDVVVVEGTTAGDMHGVPDSEKACVLGGGAVLSFMDKGTLYAPETIGRLTALCRENEIRYQLKTLVAGGNEAQVYQRNAPPAVVAAVSAPVRYIHSACSVADTGDFDEVYKLLVQIAANGL